MIAWYDARMRILIILSSFLLVTTVSACGDDDGGTDSGTIDSGGDDAGGDDAGGDDAGGDDAGGDDAGGDDAGGDDAGGDDAAADDSGPPASDAMVGAACSFNRDCASDQRCECDGECMCAVGDRGTGGVGEACEDAEDCLGGVCLDLNSETFYCTDECESADDCAEPATECVEIPFVGMGCAVPEG